MMDFLAYSLTVLWALLLADPAPRGAVACQILLSLSAIPLAVSLLQVIECVRARVVGEFVCLIFVCEWVSVLCVPVWMFVGVCIVFECVVSVCVSLYL